MSEVGTTTGESATTTGAEAATKKSRRPFCTTCDRPRIVCICESLPKERICLKRCHCVVHQHPHEARRKNRSLPFVRLCLDEERSLTIIRSRRLHLMKDTKITRATNLWLVYPHPDAVSLTDAILQQQQQQQQQRQQQQQEQQAEGATRTSDATEVSQEDDSTETTITLLFIDATWKFAKQMYRENQHLYPATVKRVQLTKNDLMMMASSSSHKQFVPRRFDIRTPVSDQHLSTAECIAWTLSKIENDRCIYDTIMKPLDTMVSQWHQFQEKRERQEQQQLQGPEKPLQDTQADDAEKKSTGCGPPSDGG